MHKITLTRLFRPLPSCVLLFCEDTQMLHCELQKMLQGLCAPHTLDWLEVGQSTVFYLLQKVQAKGIFNWQSNRLSLLHLPGVPQNFLKRLLLGKYSLKASTSIIPAALFEGGEFLNALLLGQSLSKPDSVAVPCIYKTRLVIFRTTEEKLEKKREKQANLNTEATSSISLFWCYIFIRKINIQMIRNVYNKWNQEITVCIFKTELWSHISA